MSKNNIQIALLGVIAVLLGIGVFKGFGGGDGNIRTAAKEATNPQQNNVANANNPANPIQPTNAPVEEKVDPDKLTTMKFDKTEFDFGKVKEGEKVKYTYKFTNTGKKPLEIKSCKGSCGCTVPKCPTEPIAPGASADIPVEFDSNHKAGNQSKTVTVVANTEPVNTVLTIKGEVLPDPNKKKEDPTTPKPQEAINMQPTLAPTK